MDEDVVTARRRGLLLLFRYDAGGLAVRLGKMVVDIAATNQASDELPTEEGIVWWESTENIGIHDIDEPFSTRLRVPFDEFVPHRQIEHGVANRNDADQLAIVFVPDQESESPAKAVGYRHRPSQGGKPE